MGKYNEDVYQTVNKWRAVLNESKEEREEKEENTPDCVPYTMQDQLMRSITETCRQQFGADFSQSKNPMLYYPPKSADNSSENVSLSGLLGSDFSGAKFHFKWKDPNGGCYIWTSPVNLNEHVLETLKVIFGVYQNWKKELDAAQDRKPMSMKNESDEDYVPSIPTGMA